MDDTNMPAGEPRPTPVPLQKLPVPSTPLHPSICRLPESWLTLHCVVVALEGSAGWASCSLFSRGDCVRLAPFHYIPPATHPLLWHGNMLLGGDQNGGCSGVMSPGFDLVGVARIAEV